MRILLHYQPTITYNLKHPARTKRRMICESRFLCGVKTCPHAVPHKPGKDCKLFYCSSLSKEGIKQNAQCLEVK
jgi:hypothetical protein